MKKIAVSMVKSRLKMALILRGLKTFCSFMSRKGSVRHLARCSVAATLVLAIASVANAASVTGTGGGSGGSSYSLSCNAGEVVVGVRGKAGNWLDGIGLRCVAVNDKGEWVGTVQNRGYTGQTSVNFSRTCAQNSAVSGLKGRSGWYVDRLEVQCRTLTTGRKTTGTRSYLSAVGGTGGSAFGPLNCPEDRPAYGAYGKSGQYLDSIGFTCEPTSSTSGGGSGPKSSSQTMETQ